MQLGNKRTSFNNLDSNLQRGKPCRTESLDGSNVDFNFQIHLRW